MAGRDQMRQLFDADVEAFLDHWGGFDATDAVVRAVDQPIRTTTRTLFVVAWDGDEIAGAVTNVIHERENEELGRLRGLLDSVFVRRPWRGRGLGFALVGRSLQLLRERGMDERVAGRRRGQPQRARCACTRTPASRSTSASTAYRKPMEVNS